MVASITLILGSGCRIEDDSPAVAMAGSGARSGSVPLTIEGRLIPVRGQPWEIQYAFSRPLREVVFVHARGDYRRSTWRMEGPDLVLDRRDDHDLVHRRDGAPFLGFSATLEPFTAIIREAYTPAIPFSDGSIAIYLDQFQLAEDPNDPSAGAWLVVDTTGFAHRVDDGLPKREPDGSYVLGKSGYLYLGDVEPFTTPHLRAVVDAPEWLRTRLLASFPRLFAFYAAHLGELQRGTTGLFVVHRTSETGRISIQGGKLEGQLVLVLELDPAAEHDGDLRLRLAQVLAHETMHLWQPCLDDAKAAMDNAWIHEGTAEFFAILALLELGDIDRETARRKLDEHAVACAAALEAGALDEAWNRNDYRAYYDCGATIWLATHAASRRAGKGGLSTLWRALERCDVDPVLSAITRHAGSSVAAKVRALVHEPQHDPRAAVVDLLRTAGVPTSEDQASLRVDAWPE